MKKPAETGCVQSNERSPKSRNHIIEIRVQMLDFIWV